MIINSNEISNCFWLNYKLQSNLRITSNWITKVIDHADLFFDEAQRSSLDRILIITELLKGVALFSLKKKFT